MLSVESTVATSAAEGVGLGVTLTVYETWKVRPGQVTEPIDTHPKDEVPLFLQQFVYPNQTSPDVLYNK